MPDKFSPTWTFDSDSPTPDDAYYTGVLLATMYYDQNKGSLTHTYGNCAIGEVLTKQISQHFNLRYRSSEHKQTRYFFPGKNFRQLLSSLGILEGPTHGIANSTFCIPPWLTTETLRACFFRGVIEAKGSLSGCRRPGTKKIADLRIIVSAPILVVQAFSEYLAEHNVHHSNISQLGKQDEFSIFGGSLERLADLLYKPGNGPSNTTFSIEFHGYTKYGVGVEHREEQRKARATTRQQHHDRVMSTFASEHTNDLISGNQAKEKCLWLQIPESTITIGPACQLFALLLAARGSRVSLHYFRVEKLLRVKKTAIRTWEKKLRDLGLIRPLQKHRQGFPAIYIIPNKDKYLKEAAVPILKTTLKYKWSTRRAIGLLVNLLGDERITIAKKRDLVFGDCDIGSLKRYIPQCLAAYTLTRYGEVVIGLRKQAVRSRKEKTSQQERIDRAVSDHVSAFTQRCSSYAERLFWRLAGRAIQGIYPRYPIGKYSVDFAIPDQMICIEIDGHDYHASPEQRRKDAVRMRAIQKRGWTVIRFTGHEIFEDTVQCVKEVKRIVHAMQQMRPIQTSDKQPFKHPE